MNRKQRRKLRKTTDSTETVDVKTSKSFLRRLYEDKYKALLFVPFIILGLAVIIIVFNFVHTGSFVNKGISLKGGTSIVVLQPELDVDEVHSYLSANLKNADIHVRSLSESNEVEGLIIETDMNDNGKAVLDILKNKFKVEDKSVSVTTMGPSLGASFFKDAVIALVIAFIFMSVVVFLIFKQPTPSLAVILCAFSDIVVTIALIDLFKIKLGTSGIAALLMLIGYSVDTDILLSTRVVKEQKGTVMSRIYSALRTGLTMNLTTLTTVLIGLFLSQSPELKQIFLILLFGLIIDVINTWIQNVNILRIFIEKKKNEAN